MFKQMKAAAIFTFVALFIVGSLAAPGAARAKTMKFGVVAWSDALAIGSVIENLLVNELDQDVEMTNPDIGVAYTAVKNKELDLFLEGWLPLTHEAYWDKIAPSVCNFGPFVEDAILCWAVPSYVPEDVFSSVEDMNKEEVKEKCGGKIVGIDPGSGLMQHSALMMNKYPELEDWKLVEGSDYAMAASLKRAIQRKEWIVVTLWQPHFAFGRYDLRILEEPKKILGGEERVHMIGRRDFMEVFPNEVSMFLSRFYLPISKVSELLVMYEEDEETAGQKFIRQNQDLVHYWLTGETR
jgi:glycine betaine/proline transport system substrate-binding protein